MSEGGFSPEWLELREPADHRARDGVVAMKLADRLQKRSRVNVVDLGCGTGSNIRATYALLGPEQQWTLVDYDARLLGVARQALAAWADKSREVNDKLELVKDGKTLVVGFRQADLVTQLGDVLAAKTDLVTASALFDLCSASFIDRFAAAVAAQRAMFYTVLSYNGQQYWTPRHDADEACAAAFKAHQKTDKGFGVSTGPDCPDVLRAAFVKQGYTVAEGNSPWLLSRSDQRLIDELSGGFIGAVAETGRIDEATIASWRSTKRHGAEVGHTDTLAWPE